MDAEGIREIANMQRTIDQLATSLRYIRLQLEHPDNFLSYPSLEDEHFDGRLRFILNEIRALQNKPTNG